MIGYILLSLAFLSALFLIWFFFQKKLSLLQTSLKDSFQSLSFEIAEKNNRSFLDLAKLSLEKSHGEMKRDFDVKQKSIEESLKPIHETISKLDQSQRELEKRRESAYQSLSKQVDTMILAERELRQETAKLSQSLKSPQMRGSWGEVHLKRVVELAGLLSHCDFFDQKTLVSEGKVWRPDLIVHLPGGRSIAVDAKTPLSAYLDASDAGNDELRKIKLQEHSQLLRKHIKELSQKEYWNKLEMAPEYVILFLPAEAFFSAALQSDPALIEVGASQNIIVATPTTLIAILRAVAFSWKQDALSKNAKEMAKLGADLYERIGTLAEHWGKVGKNLNAAVDTYNQSIASLESRVLVTARKLKENGKLTSDINEPKEIENQTKSLKNILTSS